MTRHIPWNTPFHLLEDVRGKTVLDFGCGNGENVLPLVTRGANVIGIDISRDLIDLAKRRLLDASLEADLRVESAYNTGLADHSVDVIFCMSLIHHLEISRAQREMSRILRQGGYVVMKEPVCFSRAYNRLRNMLPARDEISDYEHPLTVEEFKELTQGFIASDTRFFRLPFVPLFGRVLSENAGLLCRASNWIINAIPSTQRYASVVVTKLRLGHEE